LKIDDDLAPVSERQGDHAADALVVDIRIRCIIDTVTCGLDRLEQGFRAILEFEVSHYNLPMLKMQRILAAVLLLAPGLAALGGCGQKGNLYLPTDPAASGRAPLPQAAGNSIRAAFPAPPGDKTAPQPGTAASGLVPGVPK
jgi:predicted small lipoprotein YifL